MISVIAENAGITALSVLVYLIKRGVKLSDITLYTEKFGGEWMKGGLKIINCTKETKDFISNLEIDYTVQRVNGAVLWDDDTLPFPECFQMDDSEGYQIQKMYWDKTRPNSEYDNRCMNEPWTKYVPELKIIPFGGVGRMISTMELISRAGSCINVVEKIDKSLLDKVIKQSDLVIYTMPMPLLLDVLDIDAKQELSSASLTIQRFKMDVRDVNKIWWEYLYIPQEKYKFHRLSLTEDELHVETNSDIVSWSDNWDSICSLLDKLHGVNPKGYINSGSFQIKGQIAKDATSDVLSKIPSNVVLLGRYAEWNKRVTWDKVLEKLYKIDIKPFVY